MTDFRPGFTIRPTHDDIYAVWAGRFQPFHAGHLATLRQIVDGFRGPITVMIIQSSGWLAANEDELMDAQHVLSKNPFTVWERTQMISLIVGAENLADRVSLVGIPRPDILWEAVRSFYPPNRVICLTDRDQLDQEKRRLWLSRGEQIWTVKTGPTSTSSTALKEALRSGEDWRRYLHPAIHDYFLRIGGPARLIRASS